MAFDSDYNGFVVFSKKLIQAKKIINIDPSDLVNDAFIAFTETKQPYSIETIKNLIVKSLWKEFGYYQTIVSPGFTDTKVNNATCKKCGDDKPVHGFYIKTVDTVKSIFPYCKDCIKEIRKQYYEENKDSILSRSATWKENNKNRCKLAHQLWYKTNVNPNAVFGKRQKIEGWKRDQEKVRIYQRKKYAEAKALKGKSVRSYQFKKAA
jgi:hypothetical protein